MPNGDQKNKEAGAGNKWAVMGGIALNVEYTRKYGFEATAAARVTAKLVAIPPPTLFQEAVQADTTGRAKRAEALAPPLPRPPGDLPRLAAPAAVSLIDDRGVPLADTRYVVTFPDGSELEDRFDSGGETWLENAKTGRYTLTFPDFEASEWEIIPI